MNDVTEASGHDERSYVVVGPDVTPIDAGILRRIASGVLHWTCQPSEPTIAQYNAFLDAVPSIVARVGGYAISPAVVWNERDTMGARQDVLAGVQRCVVVGLRLSYVGILGLDMLWATAPADIRARSCANRIGKTCSEACTLAGHVEPDHSLGNPLPNKTYTQAIWVAVNREYFVAPRQATQAQTQELASKMVDLVSKCTYNVGDTRGRRLYNFVTQGDGAGLTQMELDHSKSGVQAYICVHVPRLVGSRGCKLSTTKTPSRTDLPTGLDSNDAGGYFYVAGHMYVPRMIQVPRVNTIFAYGATKPTKSVALPPYMTYGNRGETDTLAGGGAPNLRMTGDNLDGMHGWSQVWLPELSVVAQLYAEARDRDPLSADRTMVSTLHPRMRWFFAECMRPRDNKSYRLEAIMFYSSGGFTIPFPVALAFMALGVTSIAPLERMLGLTSATVDGYITSDLQSADTTPATHALHTMAGLQVRGLSGEDLYPLLAAVLTCTMDCNISLHDLAAQYVLARTENTLACLLFDVLAWPETPSITVQALLNEVERKRSQYSGVKLADALLANCGLDADFDLDLAAQRIQATLRTPLAVLARAMRGLPGNAAVCNLWADVCTRWNQLCKTCGVELCQSRITGYTSLAMIDTTIAVSLRACEPHVHKLMTGTRLPRDTAIMVAARAILVMLTRRTRMDEERYISKTSTLERMEAMTPTEIVAKSEEVHERTMAMLLCHIGAQESELKLATLHDMCIRVIGLASGHTNGAHMASEETRQVITIKDAFEQLLLTGLRNDLSQATQSIVKIELPKYNHDLDRVFDKHAGPESAYWSANRASNAFRAFMTRSMLPVGQRLIGGWFQIVLRPTPKSIQHEQRAVVLSVDRQSDAPDDRALDITHYGFFDPVHTPDGKDVGLKRRLASTASLSPALPAEERDDLIRVLVSFKPHDSNTGLQYLMILPVTELRKLAGEAGDSFLRQASELMQVSPQARPMRDVMRMLLEQLETAGSNPANRMAQIMPDGSMMRVLVDGVCIGFACNAALVVRVVHEWRASSYSRRGVMAYVDSLRGLLVISTTENRLIRPLFRVHPSLGGASYAIAVLDKHQRLARGVAREVPLIRLDEAYMAGTVVFVDAGTVAESRLLVGRAFDAPCFAVGGNGATVCEIESLAVLGTLTAGSPLVQHATSPRLTFQSGMDPQAIGACSLTSGLPDTVNRKVHELQFAQRDLVATRLDLTTGDAIAPRGQNWMTVIACEGSWNAEDGGVVNRDSAQLGLGSYTTTMQRRLEETRQASVTRYMRPRVVHNRPIDQELTLDEQHELEFHVEGDVIFAGPGSKGFPLIACNRATGEKGEDASKLTDIDDDGIIAVGSLVKPNSIIARKICFVTDHGASAQTVERAMRTTNNLPLLALPEYEYYTYVLPAVVRSVRSLHVPGSGTRSYVITFELRSCLQLGSKIARRHSQKSTISMLFRRAHMPYVRSANPAIDGMIPDAFMSPFQLWRLSEAPVVAGLLAMAALEKSAFVNGTAFRSNVVDTAYLRKPPDPQDSRPVQAAEVDLETMHPRTPQAQDLRPANYSNPVDPNTALLHIFEAVGKDRFCEVTMVHGSTGLQMQGKFYLCCMYTTVLEHLPVEKHAARARSVRSQQTGQPLGGKVHGGQKAGWQELSAMQAHGAAFFLKDWTMKLSDGITVPACRTCGMLAYQEAGCRTGTNADVKCMGCSALCTDGSNIVWVQIPQSFRLLVQECMSMNIAMRLCFGDDKNPTYVFPGDPDHVAKIPRVAPSLFIPPALARKQADIKLRGTLRPPLVGSGEDGECDDSAASVFPNKDDDSDSDEAEDRATARTRREERRGQDDVQEERESDASDDNSMESGSDKSDEDCE